MPDEMAVWAGILILCLAGDPTQRPAFSEIVEKFKHKKLDLPACDDSASRAFFQPSGASRSRRSPFTPLITSRRLNCRPRRHAFG
jgi:hypothetical protein